MERSIVKETIVVYQIRARFPAIRIGLRPSVTSLIHAQGRKSIFLSFTSIRAHSPNY